MTYVHDSARFLGTVLADLSGSTPSISTARYYSRDNIGSTRRLRDSSKNSLGQYEYDLYGSDYFASGASNVDKFTGHEWDETSNVYLTAFRGYSPNLAVWLSRDPLSQPHSTLYAYGGRNLANSYDPLGLTVISPGTCQEQLQCCTDNAYADYDARNGYTNRIDCETTAAKDACSDRCKHLSDDDEYFECYTACMRGETFL